MANLRPFRHEDFFSFFNAKPTAPRSALRYALCSLQSAGFMQTEMDPIVKELGAQPFYCGSGSTSRSPAFICHLHAGSMTLLDSLHMKFDAESKPLDLDVRALPLSTTSNIYSGLRSIPRQGSLGSFSRSHSSLCFVVARANVAYVSGKIERQTREANCAAMSHSNKQGDRLLFWHKEL